VNRSFLLVKIPSGFPLSTERSPNFWNYPSPSHSLNFPNAWRLQHLLNNIIISFFKICCFLHQKWPYISSTIPGKSLTGFYKLPQMTSPSLFLWSFSRQSLILVFLQYFGGISPKVPMKIYPSSLFSWLSYSFDWRTHFSPISEFQTPGTIQGDWVKATQWLAGGRMSCTEVCLVSGTTLEVYTKQFEFLKNYMTDKNEGYKELWHQQFHCLVYLHW